MSKKDKKEFKELPLGAEAAAVESHEYVRTRWKHYMRWLMFLFLLLYCSMLVLTTYKVHFLQHKGFNLSEVMVYFLSCIMMLPIVPSVVMEVDYVKVEPDDIVFQNLLMRRTERWEDIVKFWDPVYLKFAIVKTKSMIYLINRRDLPNFPTLLETIKHKSIALKK